MSVIGLSGFGSAGKTTVACYLEEHYGYRRKHIGEPIRDMLRPLLAACGYNAKTIESALVGDLKEKPLAVLGRSGRALQISLGTAWGRKRVSWNIWVDIWRRGVLYGDRVLNDSVRFPNEEKAVHDLGGFTILIVRPGVGPSAYRWPWLGAYLHRRWGKLWGAHDSERTDRLSPDHVIVNDKGLDELFAAVDKVMRLHGLKKMGRPQ